MLEPAPVSAVLSVLGAVVSKALLLRSVPLLEAALVAVLTWRLPPPRPMRGRKVSTGFLDPEANLRNAVAMSVAAVSDNSASTEPLHHIKR